MPHHKRSDRAEGPGPRTLVSRLRLSRPASPGTSVRVDRVSVAAGVYSLPPPTPTAGRHTGRGAPRAEGPAGGRLTDFPGSNPTAARLAGTGGGGKMTTRRWFYLIP